MVIRIGPISLGEDVFFFGNSGADGQGEKPTNDLKGFP